jgi:Skp family chaperone for outer membrane proteins
MSDSIGKPLQEQTMKTAWVWGLIAAMAAGLSVGLWRSAAAQNSPAPDVPIGLVDMVKAFNECEQWKAVNAGLNKKRQAQDQEAEKMKEEIAAKTKQIDAYHPDSPEWTKAAEELMMLQTKAEVWAKMQKVRTEAQKKRWVEKNYADVTKAIAEVAKKRGLVLVLTKEEIEPNTEDSNRLFAQIINRKVVYGDKRLELTDDVLKRLNEEFKLGGGENAMKFE